MELCEQEIVIKDACILIDLIDLKLLEEFFQLDLTVFTTLQVIGEITDETQRHEMTKFINNGKLQIDSEGELQIISEINEKYIGLSLADSSVLELAKRKEAVILSSDRTLRKISTKEKIIVRGFLWIIEELYNTENISLENALVKLKNYKSVNQRAPKEEIEKLIKKISK